MKRVLIFFLTCLAGPLSAQTFTGAGGAIPDNQTQVSFPVTVSGLSGPLGTSFGLETVCVDITHTWDSDLDVRLRAPDGTTVTLFNGVGGDGDNFTNTCLNAGAASSIASGSAPFTGTYRPQGALGMVNNGQNGNGTWTLLITDTYAADVGTLLSFSLTFGNNPAVSTPMGATNLPLVIIETHGQSIVDEPKITADMGIVDNGPGNLNHLNDPRNAYNGKIGIEGRGHFSSILPQKPYDFETRDSLGNNREVSLLGMPVENDWLLLANYNDKSFMRNLLSFHLYQQLGHYATRARLSEVVLNGEYQGIYLLAEQIKRDSNRVDIAKLTPTDITWPEISGGYIIKTDYWDASNSWLGNFHPIGHPSFNIHWVYYEPKPTELVPAQKAYIQDFFSDVEGALYAPGFEDPINGYRKYLSMTSFYDYFIVNELARNGDGFKKSRFYYKEKDDANGTLGKLKAGPVWDFDWAWKNIPGCVHSEMTDGSGWAYMVNECGPDNPSPGWEVRMFQDSTFANALRCRWDSLRSSLLDTTYLFHFMDSVATLVDSAQMRHYDYWGHMGQATGAPEVDPPAQSYAEEVSRLKNWIWLRLQWLDANLPGTCNPMVSIGEPEKSTWQTAPQPFGDALCVQGEIPSSGRWSFVLWDARGQVVTTLFEGNLNPGSFTQTFPMAELASGLYLLKINGPGTQMTHRVVRQ